MMSGDNSENTLQKILNECIASKNELKTYIAASEAKLLSEIQSLKSKIVNLEKEYSNLKFQLEKIDRNSNKKVIIIFGLEKPSEVTPAFICEEIRRLLQVELKESDFSDLYQLGKKNNCPIKVEFISYFKKKDVILNARKLKRSQISIANDLTPQQSEEIRKLKSFLKKIRDRTSRKAYIRGNKIMVGTKEYTLGQLECSEGITLSDTPHLAKEEINAWNEDSSSEEEISDSKSEDAVFVKNNKIAPQKSSETLKINKLPKCANPITHKQVTAGTTVTKKIKQRKDSAVN
ncbi:hypothetical protein WA026_018837 [Henosepilachna vigintioctopunctata]|uniref:Endonuclease-reverse transcriptase n=1 Tax=Henosepilachna vigintioctopunctata TaxID=420089 RepID=A0AAW1TW98_9CUCU